MNKPDVNHHTFPDEPPRVKPLPVEGMRPEWVSILERIPGAGLKGRYLPAHVLGCLMQSPEIFGPFIEYWVTSKQKFSLSVREQELVILRMAMIYRSNYIWKHHVPVGREFGITASEMDALRRPDGPASFSGREAAILELTDEMAEHKSIRAEVWKRNSAVLSTVEIVDLIHLFAQYVVFALANNCLQVQLENVMDEVNPAL